MRRQTPTLTPGRSLGEGERSRPVLVKRRNFLVGLGASRVAVLVHPENPAHPPQLKRTMSAAQTVGIQLVLSEADTVAEAKPGELPFEQPTRYSVVINLKTAKARRLTIPPALLEQAEEAIQ